MHSRSELVWANSSVIGTAKLPCPAWQPTAGADAVYMRMGAIACSVECYCCQRQHAEHKSSTTGTTDTT